MHRKAQGSRDRSSTADAHRVAQGLLHALASAKPQVVSNLDAAAANLAPHVATLKSLPQGALSSVLRALEAKLGATAKGQERPIRSNSRSRAGSGEAPGATRGGTRGAADAGDAPGLVRVVKGVKAMAPEQETAPARDLQGRGGPGGKGKVAPAARKEVKPDPLPASAPALPPSRSGPVPAASAPAGGVPAVRHALPKPPAGNAYAGKATQKTGARPGAAGTVTAAGTAAAAGSAAAVPQSSVTDLYCFDGGDEEEGQGKVATRATAAGKGQGPEVRKAANKHTAVGVVAAAARIGTGEVIRTGSSATGGGMGKGAGRGVSGTVDSPHRAGADREDAYGHDTFLFSPHGEQDVVDDDGEEDGIVVAPNKRQKKTDGASAQGTKDGTAATKAFREAGTAAGRLKPLSSFVSTAGHDESGATAAGAGPAVPLRRLRRAVDVRQEEVKKKKGTTAAALVPVSNARLPPKAAPARQGPSSTRPAAGLSFYVPKGAKKGKQVMEGAVMQSAAGAAAAVVGERADKLSDEAYTRLLVDVSMPLGTVKRAKGKGNDPRPGDCGAAEDAEEEEEQEEEQDKGVADERPGMQGEKQGGGHVAMQSFVSASVAPTPAAVDRTRKGPLAAHVTAAVRSGAASMTAPAAAAASRVTTSRGAGAAAPPLRRTYKIPRLTQVAKRQLLEQAREREREQVEGTGTEGWEGEGPGTSASDCSGLTGSSGESGRRARGGATVPLSSRR